MPLSLRLKSTTVLTGGGWPQKVFAALLPASLLIGLSPDAVAQTWSGAIDNNYNDDFNWIPNGVPSAAGTAIFSNLGMLTTVDLTSNSTVASFLFASGAPGYTINLFDNLQVVGTGLINQNPAQEQIVSVGPGFTLFFQGGASIQDVTVRVNSGAGFQIRNTSSGGNGRIISDGRTILATDTGIVTFGSLEGSGRVHGLLSTGSQSLTIGSLNTSTVFSGQIYDDGETLDLTKAGTGTLTLSGANTYTGGTKILGGTLQIGAGGTSGSITGDVLNNGTLAFNRSDDLTFAGEISGTGGVTKLGAGTLTLTNGANDYSGQTMVSAGTLRPGAAGGLSASSDYVLASGATLAINAGEHDIGSLSGAGTVRLDGADVILHVGNNDKATTFAGSFTGPGSLEVDGISTVLTLTGTSAIGGDLVACCATIDIKGRFAAGGMAATDGGTINVTGGGRLDTAFLTSIAGDINVVGAGSLVHADDVALQATVGDAELNIAGGGKVATANRASLASIAFGTASASVRGAGSEWSVGGELAVGDSISGIPTPGVLTVAEGGRVSADTLLIGEEGEVMVGTGGVGGIIATPRLVNRGTLTFNHSDDITLDTALSGNGAFTKSGSGTLTLSGTNTATGRTTLSGGTLVGDVKSLGKGAITNNARLVLDQATDASFGSSLSGTGAFVKRGGGRLDLVGTHSFAGRTQVQAGDLAVNGSLRRSAVTIMNGASLSGTGTVGSILAQAGATVAPGNSIGTLAVAGDVAFSAGSTYRVEVDAQGHSDRIAAQGQAVLSGGTVFVPSDRGSYSDTTNYTILTAAAGLTGQFSVADTDFAFLTPTLIYSGESVTLTLKRKVVPPTPPAPPQPVSFTSVATSRNQYDTAAAVEALGQGKRLYDTILGASTGGARQALDALSGEAHGSAMNVAYQDAVLVGDAIVSRLTQPMPSTGMSVSAAYAADRPGASADPVPVTVPGFDPRRFALWGQGFGSWGRTSSDGNAASLDRSTGGFLTGADMALDPIYRVGVAGGFTRSTFDIDSRRSSGSTESVFGAVYGSAQWGAIGLRVGASYAGHDIDTRRSVVFPAFADQTSASYDGSTLQAFGEIGYGMQVAGLQFEPFLGASVLRLHTDAFQENGGASALTGYSRSQELGTTTLGLKVEAALGEASGLTLHGTIGWRRAYGDLAPSSLLAFDGGAAPFLVYGLPVDRDALVAKAGLDWQASRDVTLGVSYNGQIGRRGQDHAVNGNLTWRF